MRVAGRAAAAAIAALAAGLIVSWVGAVWLRSAVPQAGVIWRIAPPAKVAVWTLAGAHGASLHLEAGAEVDENLGRIGDRIGDLLGREGGLLGDDGSAGPRADLDVRLSSLTVLACAGLVMTLVTRMSGAKDLRDVAVAAAIAGGIYAIGLAALTVSADARLGFDLRIVSAGVEASASPVAASAFGALWGAAFALVGGLSAPAVAGTLSSIWRAIGAGLRRAALVSSAAAVVCLVVLALTQQGATSGTGLDPSLGALGAVLLGVNVVAAAVVLAHGPTMQIALDAGPLAEWTQIGYLTQGERTLSPARWLFVLVPLLGGIAAGRVMRKRVSSADAFRVAALFGVLWGIALTVLTLLLRVRVLSNFSLTSLESAGSVAIDPLITLLLSSVWGGITAYIGLVAGSEAEIGPTVEEPVPMEPAPAAPELRAAIEAPVVAPSVAMPAGERRCANCGRRVPEGDRFCMSCGTALT
jgi:hypothetical protein